MNHKGQSLILFVFLIPILIMAFAYIFDSALIVSENIKLKNISNTALTYILKDNKDSDTVRDYVSKNDKEIVFVELTINEDNATVHLQKKIDSVFGKIVGFNEYELNANYIGYIENEKVIIREKG